MKKVVLAAALADSIGTAQVLGGLGATRKPASAEDGAPNIDRDQLGNARTLSADLLPETLEVVVSLALNACDIHQYTLSSNWYSFRSSSTAVLCTMAAAIRASMTRVFWPSLIRWSAERSNFAPEAGNKRTTAFMA